MMRTILFSRNSRTTDSRGAAKSAEFFFPLMPLRAACALMVLGATLIRAQEATSGFDLRTTLSAAGTYSRRLTEAPRSSNPLSAGLRGMLYPTWKLNRNWTVAGAVQVHSRPYFAEQFSSQGNGVKADILQAHLSYSRFWNNGSVVVRAGQLSSAFGSFLLRYDDADNPLVNMPLAYGYYYKPITNYGLAGAQVDITSGKTDARLQFATSSPANRRSVFDHDQYGNWAAGLGYTIVQGFRVGASAYRGPYLHRQYAYYFPGEAKPSELIGSGYGLDVQWGRGHWNVSGEMQWFRREYRAIPTFTEKASYAEARRVLHPRWYTAVRAGDLRSNRGSVSKAYETTVGFRPNRHQLIKVGYQIGKGAAASALTVQVVTTLRLVSIARD
ncbi:MAG: hypothetical protein ACRD7E_21190 [Bryobacteraceae bacterium]